jgi:hypothetical protein
MIITLIIYVLIIGYIILKAFYTSISIKPFNNNQKIKKFSDSINLISMPFYIKMSQIHLLCIFINLILISFIFLPNLMNDLILSISTSNITYCQDSSDSSEDENYNYNFRRYINKYENPHIYWNKAVEETYGIFSCNMPFDTKFKNINMNENPLYIYYLNHHNFEIKDYSKVSQGFLRDIDNILNRQNNWIQEIFSSQKTLTAIEFNDVTGRITTTSKLISKAFDNFIVSNNNNTPQINIDNLTFKVNYAFFTLAKVSPILSDIDSFNRNWDGNQIIIYPEEIQQFRG